MWASLVRSRGSSILSSEVKSVVTEYFSLREILEKYPLSGKSTNDFYVTILYWPLRKLSVVLGQIVNAGFWV